jgi:hypothetical protein
MSPGHWLSTSFYLVVTVTHHGSQRTVEKWLSRVAYVLQHQHHLGTC